MKTVYLNRQFLLAQCRSTSFTYTQTQPRFGGEKKNKTQNILVILFQKICSISCKIEEKEDLLEWKPHSQRLSGGVSYLGGHDAEAHAIVLLQSYRDNLWLLPHWLKRETDRKGNLIEQRGFFKQPLRNSATVWCLAYSL